ncbi:hypothetical protein JCM5353_008995 [Sporobolomyces roseus]
MPPKRKDATHLVQPSASTSSRSSPPVNKLKFSPLRFISRIIRTSICLFALYALYKRYNPSNTSPSSSLAHLREEQGRVTYEEIELDEYKRDRILDAFKHSYAAYERDAFGFDDFHPISHSGSNMSPSGPVGYFIIDSLDSLHLAGMMGEYKRARDWVVENVKFEQLDDKFHTFEITIRVLGGLLSAYHLDGEQDTEILEKAKDLADRLLPAFDTPSGLPLSFINLAKRQGIADKDNHGLISVAEAGTLQVNRSLCSLLEFKYLSELTGNPIYWRKVEKAMEVIRNAPSKDGLVPIFLRPDTGLFIPSDIRLGSRGDSFYEYLMKQYLQTNRTEKTYREMHDRSMGGVKEWLVKSSRRGEKGDESEGVVYTAELQPRKNRMGQVEFVEVPKMCMSADPTFLVAVQQDHLVCFLPGLLLLGSTTSSSQSTTISLPPLPDQDLTERELDDWVLGKELLKTCVDTYFQSRTGLAPEIVNFYTPYSPAASIDKTHLSRQWFINSRKLAAPNPPIDARNILRPETVESLFVAYRTTGDPIYREWGWKIFEAFEKHCRLKEGGFASILDVDQLPVEYEDRMETFWLSETLKYLLLLFSEKDLIPLDQYVFNTEAHPLPIFTPTVVDVGL